MSTPAVSATLYLDVTSSWCFWAEPAWAALRERFAGEVAFGWKIALLDAEAVPGDRAAMEWFYRRSGTITGSAFMLNSAWFEPGALPYLVPNLLAEAGKDLGIGDDRLRLALSHAALRDGRRILQWDEALGVCSALAEPATLRAKAESPEIHARIEAATAEWRALGVTQRPTFVFESVIGDRTVLSGTWRLEPLAAAVESMLADARGYANYAAHHGGGPG